MHGIAADGNIPTQNLNGYIAAAIGILGFLNASVSGKLVLVFAAQQVFTFFRQRECMVRIAKTSTSAVTISKIFDLFFIQS